MNKRKIIIYTLTLLSVMLILSTVSAESSDSNYTIETNEPASTQTDTIEEETTTLSDTNIDQDSSENSQEEKQIIVISHDSGTFVNEDLILSGIVVGVDGEVLTDSNVSINIGVIAYGDENYTELENIVVKTDNEGKYTLVYKPTLGGNFNITAISNDINQSSTINFYILPKSTIVTMDPISQICANETLNITGRLTDGEGNILRNTSVGIMINGIPYGYNNYERYSKEYAKTDNNGYYSYIYKPQTAGHTDIIAYYPGYHYYRYNNTQSAIYVFPIETQVTLNQVEDIQFGESINISGKLTDYNGRVLRNTSVGMNLFGDKIYVKTDYNGLFSYNYKPIYAGKYNLIVYFPGYNKYKFSQDTIKFNVSSNSSSTENAGIYGITSNEILRCSIEWDEKVDLDLFCSETSEYHSQLIFYGNRFSKKNGGVLSNDVTEGTPEMHAIENITYSNNNTFLEGTYEFSVKRYDDYNKSNIGFKCELLVDGKLHIYPIKGNIAYIKIAKVTYKNGEFSVTNYITSIEI